MLAVTTCSSTTAKEALSRRQRQTRRNNEVCGHPVRCMYFQPGMRAVKTVHSSRGRYRTMTTCNASTSPSMAIPTEQLQWNMSKPLVLFSDIDDTMLGPTAQHDQATLHFKELWGHKANLHKPPRLLVYNTGRSLESYQDIWSQKLGVMRSPELLICGVGTRIYWQKTNEDGIRWEEDESWTSHINEGWDITAVQHSLKELIKEYGEDRLHYADAHEQHDHKQTVRVAPSLLPEVLTKLTDRLTAAGVHPLLVSGGGPDWGFVDVLPHKAGKGSAAEFARQRLEQELGMDLPQHACVVAGDSNNDIQMLSGCHWAGAIVVGNAVSTVKSWAHTVLKERESRQTNGNSTKCGQLLLVESHTAYGILEGLRHLGWLKPAGNLINA